MRKERIAFIGVLMSVISMLGVNAQQTSLSPDLQKIIWASHFVVNNYVDTVNEKQFADETIAAMLQTLDPHSSYVPAREGQQYNAVLMGAFEGIGVTFNLLHDTITVISVTPAGPSQKVGILPGDRIIRIDDSIVAGVKIQNTEVKPIEPEFLDFSKDTVIVSRVAHDSDVLVILGGSTNQRNASDVDFLDNILFGSAACHGGFKGVEVDDNEVYLRNFVLSQLLAVREHVAAAEDAAEHFGVQRLDAASED